MVINIATVEVWVSGYYDKNGKWVSGYYKGGYVTDYHKGYYYTYGWSNDEYDQLDYWEYNQVVPYQIWDKFEGTGIWNKIPNGKNTAFFYYNKTHCMKLRYQ